MKRPDRGFTIIEIIIIIVLIAILAAITMVAYNGYQRNASVSVTKATVADALKSLQIAYVRDRYYPSNVAGTDYAPPLSVGVVLYTNAPQSPVYTNLSDDQNAQLFLNGCNAQMPIVVDGSTYNTVCSYDGNNVHIKGQKSSNIVFAGPEINQSDIVLSCGSACAAAQQRMIELFLLQGGYFPIIVPKKGAELPPPTTYITEQQASKFCLEGRAASFNDVIYHAVSDKQEVEDGPCPPDAELHYP